MNPKTNNPKFHALLYLLLTAAFTLATFLFPGNFAIDIPLHDRYFVLSGRTIDFFLIGTTLLSGLFLLLRGFRERKIAKPIWLLIHFALITLLLTLWLRITHELPFPPRRYYTQTDSPGLNFQWLWAVEATPVVLGAFLLSFVLFVYGLFSRKTNQEKSA